MKVKLTQAVNRRQPGEIIDVDSASAKNLVEKKKVATYVDGPPAEQPAAPARRGDVVAYQVADEDNPNAKDPADEEAADDGADQGDSDADQ